MNFLYISIYSYVIVIGNDDVPGIRILMERIIFQTRDAAHAKDFSILGHI